MILKVRKGILQVEVRAHPKKGTLRCADAWNTFQMRPARQAASVKGQIEGYHSFRHS